MKTVARLVQGALLAASLGPLTVAAQSFPSRQITMEVPASPGGAIDLAARLIGQKLTGAWGRPVVIENKAGATGIVGTAPSSPDELRLALAVKRFHTFLEVLRTA